MKYDVLMMTTCLLADCHVLRCCGAYEASDPISAIRSAAIEHPTRESATPIGHEDAIERATDRAVLGYVAFLPRVFRDDSAYYANHPMREAFAELFGPDHVFVEIDDPRDARDAFALYRRPTNLALWVRPSPATC